jgi:hypothetical protein
MTMLVSTCVDEQFISKSKARRQRAAALQKKLWQAVDNGASSAMDARLARLESLITDIHWVTLGQWHLYHDAYNFPINAQELQENFEVDTTRMSAQTGGKAELGEVSPSTSSCILQRSLDVVPRAGCTGPLGQAEHDEMPSEEKNNDGNEDFYDAAENPAPSSKFEPLDPWLFLGASELGHLSQTCHRSLYLVEANTPFFNLQPVHWSSPPVNAADLGPIVNMGRVAASTVEAPCNIGEVDAASQTMGEYAHDPGGSITLTLAEAERLWAGKHQALMKEFEGMMSSQAEFYEKQVLSVGASLSAS